MFEQDSELRKEQSFEVNIEPLQQKHIEELEPVIREYVRDRNTGEIVESEIDEIKKYMRGEEEVIDKEKNITRKRIFSVALDNRGKAIGCMAYSDPDLQMVKHFEDILKMDSREQHEKCVELLNAFVSKESARGKGVGKKLFESICDNVKSIGKDIVLVNSGPRYKASWEFYDKIGMQRQGSIIGKYGEGGDAMTWIKRLSSTKAQP